MNTCDKCKKPFEHLINVTDECWPDHWGGQYCEACYNEVSERYRCYGCNQKEKEIESLKKRIKEFEQAKLCDCDFESMHHHFVKLIFERII